MRTNNCEYFHQKKNVPSLSLLLFCLAVAFTRLHIYPLIEVNRCVRRGNDSPIFVNAIKSIYNKQEKLSYTSKYYDRSFFKIAAANVNKEKENWKAKYRQLVVSFTSMMDDEAKEKQQRNKEPDESSSSYPTLTSGISSHYESGSKTDTKTVWSTVRNHHHHHHHPEYVASPSQGSRNSENMIMLAPAFHSSTPSIGVVSSTGTTTSDGKRFDSRNMLRGKESRTMKAFANDGHAMISSNGQEDGDFTTGSAQIKKVATVMDASPASDIIPDSTIQSVVRPIEADDDDEGAPQFMVAAELVSPLEDIDIAERLERQIQEVVEARITAHSRNQVVAHAEVLNSASQSWQPDNHSNVITVFSVKRRSCVYTVWIFAFLVFATVVTGVTLYFTVGREQNDEILIGPSASPSAGAMVSLPVVPPISPTVIPTAIPSAAPTLIDDFDFIRRELDPSIVRTEADLIVFDNSTSPQSLALQ